RRRRPVARRRPRRRDQRHTGQRRRRRDHLHVGGDVPEDRRRRAEPDHGVHDGQAEDQGRHGRRHEAPEALLSRGCVTAEVRAHAEEDRDEARPAWSLASDDVQAIALVNPLPDRVDREWAFGGATGRGAKVCVLDSGVEAGHPSIGAVAGAVAISLGEDGETIATPDAEGDLCGHGTACAGVIRALAPEAEIYSVRVLGAGFTGSGKVLLAGLRWAVEQDYDVINMSLSTTKRAFSELLRDIADTAYFKR